MASNEASHATSFPLRLRLHSKAARAGRRYVSESVLKKKEKKLPNYAVIEMKAFVPSKDFELCKQFYVDIGFELKWSDSDLAYFSAGNSSFLLQNFYLKEHADNFMMHLLVDSADDWWGRIKARNVVEKYGISLGDPEDRVWKIRDFTLIDPTGVLWRIGNNI